MIVAALAFAACAKPLDPADREAQLSSLYEMYRSGRVEEVIPLLRAHLLEYPDDAGAHLVLGKCYLYQNDFNNLIAAEGEFETALMYFLESGRRTPLPPYTDETFELQCYLDIPKASLALALNLTDMLNRRPRLPLTFDRLIDKIEKSLNAARALDPESPAVLELEKNLEHVRALATEHQRFNRRAPEQEPPPGFVAALP